MRQKYIFKNFANGFKVYKTNLGAKIMSYTIQRFPISAEQIDTVVRTFYAKIRLHPTLGPIFNGAIGTNAQIWELHEDKIGRFWRSALLREGSYSGNPMIAHMDVPEIRQEHFAQWLDLFDSVLNDVLPKETAASFSAMAHRIGTGLRKAVVVANDL